MLEAEFFDIGQLSSAQFGLVLCSEGDLLGGSRSGEVGKGVDDALEAGQRELRVRYSLRVRVAHIRN